jgi:hypothetical protein
VYGNLFETQIEIEMKKKSCRARETTQNCAAAEK